jgi:hypothetical protein
MAKQAVSSKASTTPRKRRTAAAPNFSLHAPTHDQIARRAFELYLSRGAREGSALNDWLIAERELRTRSLDS